MITTIIILVSAVCFLLLTIVIYNLRDKINSLENTVKELDNIINKLLCKIAYLSDKIKWFYNWPVAWKLIPMLEIYDCLEDCLAVLDFDDICEELDQYEELFVHF